EGGAAPRAGGHGLGAVSRAAPDAARLARDYVGETREHAWRSSAFPGAARVKAQPAIVRHLIEWDAAALEVGLPGGARDANGFSPDAVCLELLLPFVVAVVGLWRRHGRGRSHWSGLLIGQGRHCFSHAAAVSAFGRNDDRAAHCAAPAR